MQCKIFKNESLNTTIETYVDSKQAIHFNLHKRYHGLCIELKTPIGNGVFSEAQRETLERYKANGFKCLVSNDYDLVTKTIIEYFQDVRVLCPYCPKKFKTKETLTTHKRGFHKLSDV